MSTVEHSLFSGLTTHTNAFLCETWFTAASESCCCLCNLTHRAGAWVCLWLHGSDQTKVSQSFMTVKTTETLEIKNAFRAVWPLRFCFNLFLLLTFSSLLGTLTEKNERQIIGRLLLEIFFLTLLYCHIFLFGDLTFYLLCFYILIFFLTQHFS